MFYVEVNECEKITGRRAEYSFLIEKKIFKEFSGNLCRLALIKNDAEERLIVSSEVSLQTYTLNIGRNNFYYKLTNGADGTCLLQFSNKQYPYMISVVMAVFNTESFISEALDSILQQKTEKFRKYFLTSETTFDNSYCLKSIFNEIYQVIIVDDGSNDSSGEICKSYAGEHSNFIYVRKDNGGVSSARNKGMSLAEGKYINFMDSDDVFSDNVLEECFDFFEKNEDATDIVTIPLLHFDARSEEHWANYKFKKGSRVINLLDEPDNPLYNVNASFFKTEMLKGKILFDEEMIIAEDAKFVYQTIFSGKPYMGLVKECVYNYRRRTSGETSAMESGSFDEKYYLDYLNRFARTLFLESEKTYNFVPQFVQYAVMGQLQWRMKEDLKGEKAISIIGKSGYDKYKKTFFELLKYIDYDVISSQKKIFREHKFYLFSQKAKSDPCRIYDRDTLKYYFDGNACGSLNKTYARIEFLMIEHNKITIKGFNCCYENDAITFFEVDGVRYPVDKTPEEDRDMGVYGLGDILLYQKPFSFSFELNSQKEEYEISLGITSQGYDVIKKDIRFGKFAPLSDIWKKSYYVVNNWAVRLENNRFKLENLALSKTCTDYENDLIQEIYESKKIKTDISSNKKELIIAQNIEEALKLRKYVLSYFANRAIGKNEKKIWLISDRINQAGDNGEALFNYINDTCPQNVEVYFVLKKNSNDYNKIKEKGNVIAYGSYVYKKMLLMSDVIISSHADNYVTNPFWACKEATDVVKDILCKKSFVFLQHGITKDNVSGWLNKYSKNIRGFVTAAMPEYRSILEYPYYYTEDRVWLTGFPRYDRLYHDEKKYITIMPTWRKYMLSGLNDKDGERTISERFLSSEFFSFYCSLLTDSKLIDHAEKKGYKICFMPHPTLMNNLHLFDHDPRVIMFGFEKPYREIYAESDMVITDYSSSVFDFSYLRKPILYCQFDKEEFYAGDHVYAKGYFDYEENGFGDVTYDLKTLTEKIKEKIDDGCILDSKYKKRIEKFFAYNDENNCKRVLEKLLTI